MRFEHRQIHGLFLTPTEDLYLKILEMNLSRIYERYLFTIPEDSMENLPFDEESLSSHMESLLPYLLLDDSDEEVADYIIHNLDDRGNLLVDPGEVAKRFGVDVGRVKRLMEMLKDIGPDGLFEGKVEGFGRASGRIVPDMELTPDLECRVNVPEVSGPAVLIRALEKRRRTLERVCTVVLETNTSFLRGDRLLPRKMKMKDLAERIGVSVSTASRAVKEKYLSSPRGTLPLRIFFGRSIHPELLTRLIGEIIAEYGDVPDSFIASRLRDMGFEISRRTVNKYRRWGFEGPGRSERRMRR